MKSAGAAPLANDWTAKSEEKILGPTVMSNAATLPTDTAVTAPKVKIDLRVAAIKGPLARSLSSTKAGNCV
jgi:hypothetical protein